MKRTLQRYGVHFAAVIGVIIVGIAAAGYVLAHQRFYLPNWVPIVGSDFIDYTADFNSAKAVVPGQGQTVAISGVTVGEIGRVELVNGRGRVTMKIRREYANRIHTDASAGLRPRTPLQDMVVQLDPGSRTAPIMPPGGNIPAARTMTPVEFDQILSTFDIDTRAYLAMLLQQGGKGLSGEGGKNLAGVLRSFEPATVYSARIAKALRSRNAEAARAVTNLARVTDALGKNSSALAAFVSGSADTFQAIAAEQSNLAGVVQKSPGALTATQELLESTSKIAGQLGKSSAILAGPTSQLNSGLKNFTTFQKTATPIIKNSLRPFAVQVQAPLKAATPGVNDLAASAKNVGTGTTVLRQLFDGLAYEPPGPDYSALTLAGYLSHAGMSLTSLQDAAGAVTRTVLYSDCGLVNTGLAQIRPQSPAARVLADLLGTPTPQTVLPNGKTAKDYCASIGGK